MITIKDKHALELMSKAGLVLAGVFERLAERMSVGVSTLDIDAWIALQLKEHGMISQSLGYHGYKHVSCISVNDEVVHGVPSASKIIRAGDLVKVDVCASLQGYCADMARCFFVAQPNKNALNLVEVAKSALDKGIEKAVVGGRLTDISAAIQEEVERNGFGVVRIFAGHGIGKKMHEEPEILNYGKPGKGPVLKAGMAFAIEPMITQGHYDVTIDNDGWTARTKDGSLAAHVEDTVIVTERGPLVVTRL